uniref:Ataxin 7 like 2 n=1 Tax=Aquila chrysaetos chrysaetos TaxID=223781 RepID=A0A663EKJ7_AQUCH
MTLIKEDMNIFGHCPAHDEFYLVVCNHCSQVVKPQAFQKHCERRHGPLSKLYARAAAAKCHVAVNGQPAAGGTPGAAKVLREKPPGARGRVQPLPERPDKDNNLCLFVPVVNLEKIPSIPKPDGHGIKVPPKAVPTNSKEPLGKPATAAVPKEPPVSAGVGGDSHLFPPPPQYSSGLRPPPASRCLPLPAGKECDLNRQCGVLNPDTKKICTRLLTCKIHSVHQRREVQGRAKDFDVLVAELKASSRKGESPKERSPPGKEPLPPSQQDPSSLPQPPAGPPSTSPCRAKPPHSHCPLPRARLSSDSDPEDTPAASGEGGTGVFPFPLPKAGSRVSSEESEEEGGEEPPRPPTRPPRPQAFCTFGSRLVSPGCYVFNRRLDRFCSALGSMLERHLSSHMWRKIPPAAEPPLHTPPAPPQPYHPSLRPSRLDPLTPHTDLIVIGGPPPAPGRAGSPPASTTRWGPPTQRPPAASQSAGGGGSQSITSPLPANIPSPSFSKLPSTKASKSSRAREAVGGTDPDTRKRKPPLAAGGPPYKRTCLGDGVKSKNTGCQVSAPPRQDETHPSGLPSFFLHRRPQRCNAGETARPPGLPRPPRCRRRGPPKLAAARTGGATATAPPVVSPRTRSRSARTRPRTAGPSNPSPRPPCPAHCRPRARPPPDSGGSVRRKKPGTPLGFEEKRSALKVGLRWGGGLCWGGSLLRWGGGSGCLGCSWGCRAVAGCEAAK